MQHSPETTTIDANLARDIAAKGLPPRCLATSARIDSSEFPGLVIHAPIAASPTLASSRQLAEALSLGVLTALATNSLLALPWRDPERGDLTIVVKPGDTLRGIVAACSARGLALGEFAEPPALRNIRELAPRETLAQFEPASNSVLTIDEREGEAKISVRPDGGGTVLLQSYTPSLAECLNGESITVTGTLVHAWHYARQCGAPVRLLIDDRRPVFFVEPAESFVEAYVAIKHSEIEAARAAHNESASEQREAEIAAEKLPEVDWLTIIPPDFKRFLLTRGINPDCSDSSLNKLLNCFSEIALAGAVSGSSRTELRSWLAGSDALERKDLAQVVREITQRELECGFDNGVHLALTLDKLYEYRAWKLASR